MRVYANSSAAACSKPGLFSAAYASSAVVESITYVHSPQDVARVRHGVLTRIISGIRSDFWGYFQPILEYMPKNCSADVLAVIKHIDSVFTGKDTNAINQLLSVWNFTALSNHLDDAAGARELLAS